MIWKKNIQNVVASVSPAKLQLKMTLLDVLHVCKPNETFPASLNMLSKKIMLIPMHRTKTFQHHLYR